MKMVRILFILMLIYLVNSTRKSSSRKTRGIYATPVLSPAEMGETQGYKVETHSVTTDDGYILTLHRLPKGRNEITDSNTHKPSVFLMHCIFCSSADWLMNYPEDALGFYLADNGYDVWMGNARGNSYAKNHTYLNVKSRQFWDFSFHEIAVSDVSSSIDYALKVSKNSKLQYIGYSMGVITLFVLLSEKPEYNEKVTSAALLGPASFLQNNGALMFKFAPMVDLIESVSRVVGITEIMPQNLFTNVLATSTCGRKNDFLDQLCLSLFSIMIDVDSELGNQEYLPLIFSHMPAGGSLKTLMHLMQIKNFDRFQKYDYGSRINFVRYGSYYPSTYNFDNVRIPVGLYYGTADKYVPPVDVFRVAKLLPNVVHQYEVPHSKFSHFDFLWARNATKLINKDILQFLRKY